MSAASRVESIESLVPGTARASSRKLAGRSLSVPRMTPVQRLPSSSKARTSEASLWAHASLPAAGRDGVALGQVALIGKGGTGGDECFRLLLSNSVTSRRSATSSGINSPPSTSRCRSVRR